MSLERVSATVIDDSVKLTFAQNWHGKTVLTDQQRLDKLEQAVATLREVEFSYPPGHEDRKMLYHIVGTQFSVLNPGYQHYMDRLRRAVRG